MILSKLYPMIVAPKSNKGKFYCCCSKKAVLQFPKFQNYPPPILMTFNFDPNEVDPGVKGIPYINYICFVYITGLQP